VILRRAAPLVLHWRDGRLVVENYVTRRCAPAVPPVLAVLERAGAGARAADLARVVPAAPSQARRFVRALERATFLERIPPRRSGLSVWAPWLPHAGLLHFGTKDEAYPSALAASRDFLRRAQAMPQPAPTKTYPPPRRPLPPPEFVDVPLSEALTRRRTCRRFGRAPLSLNRVATLAGLTWGVQRWARDTAGNSRSRLSISSMGIRADASKALGIGPTPAVTKAPKRPFLSEANQTQSDPSGYGLMSVDLLTSQT